MILIKKVPLKKLLGGWIFEMHFVFFNGFGVFPLLVVNVILVKIFSTLLRNVWCQKPVVLKGIPVEDCKPRMGFHLMVSIEANPTGSFACQTFVDEVGCLK